MAKTLTIALAIFFSTLSSHAQSIQDACRAVAMDCSYRSRNELLDEIFSATQKVLFDKRSNPYTRDIKDTHLVHPTRFYIGSEEQNAKLARNIMANKKLFVDGKITFQAAKRWKFVE